jgi:hypothetical protein
MSLILCHLITRTTVIKICLIQAINKATGRVQLYNVWSSTSIALIDWRGVTPMKYHIFYICVIDVDVQ